MKTRTPRPLLARWPDLERRLGWCDLGDLPTALQPLSEIAPSYEHGRHVWVKRDDVSSPVYGGNKVRTLETLFGQALKNGAQQIWSTGAFGSNHATATVLHAPRVGLRSGAIVCPQPYSRTAADNLRVTFAKADDFVATRHWSTVPYAMLRCRVAGPSRGVPTVVMAPGGATPVGALGYVSASLELAEQLRDMDAPAPARVVLGVGSTCTSAGLLVGLHVAGRLGILSGPHARSVMVHAVRVTPWPVTSAWRIVRLAVRTAELLARLGVPRDVLPARAELAAHLHVDGDRLGDGYGLPTAEGARARATLAPWGAGALDTTYTEKSAAGLLALLASTTAYPVVYWATKSSVPLPAVTDEELRAAPSAVRRFLGG